VLTHTRPWPPPCAGALVAGSVTAGFAGAGLAAAGLAAAGLAAAGLADAEVFGLNKLPSENLLGDAEGAGLAATPVFAFLRLRFSAGEAEAAAVLSSSAGETAAVASAFLCARRFPGDGDVAGDSAVEGNAAGDSAVEGDASGVPPGTSN
jgi:ABC-type Fe3+-siderophore transport system permease subunit